MNDAAPLSAAPTSARRPRVDAFGLIHKAIRFALAQTMTRMARGEATYPEIEDVLDFCAAHVVHEDTFYRPALAVRLQGPLPTFDDGHPLHERYIEELRALSKTAETAKPEHRAACTRALYLHFSKFVAENLAHMAEEEEVIQPLLERLFSDDELLAIHGRLMASLTPAEKMRSARLMFPAIDKTERAILFRAIAAQMPRPAVFGLLDMIASVISPAIKDELSALVPAEVS